MKQLSARTVALFTFPLAYLIAGCGQPTTESATQKVKSQSPRATLTAGELGSMAKNYDESVVVLVGAVQKYRHGGGLRDGPMLLVGDSIDAAVGCVFPQSVDSQLQALKIGQTVRVKGRVVKILDSAGLQNCSLD